MNAIDSNIATVLAQFQQRAAQVDRALQAADAVANTDALEEAQQIAPYRTGALRDSLHREAGPHTATSVESTVAPGDDIVYSIYLVRRGGRLDWVSRTVAERPDIAEKAERVGADALVALLNGGNA